MPTEGQGDLAHPEAADWMLGTLEPAESEEFQHHLTICGHCQVAVTEFGRIGRILQHLPPAVEPPPDLEARIIAGILAAAARMDRQVLRIPEASPAAAEPASPVPATPIQLPPPELASLYRASPDARRGLIQMAEDEPASATAEANGAAAKVQRSPRRRRRFGLYAVASAVVAAIVAAIVFLPGFSRRTSAEPPTTGGGVVAGAPVVIALHPTAGTAASGLATARHMTDGWSIQLSVHSLKQLARGEFYECWFAEAGKKSRHPVLISAGTFGIGRSGSADVSMWTAADPRQFHTMEITAESPGDVSQPGRVILSGLART